MAAINGRVLLYTLGASITSGLLFGIAPAMQGWRGGSREWLTGEGAAGRLTISVGGRRVRNAFVVAEIALSLMLLVGAGVLLRSFARLQRVDPGFDTRNVLTMRLSLPREQYKNDAVGVFFEEVSRRLAAEPGVRARVRPRSSRRGTRSRRRSRSMGSRPPAINFPPSISPTWRATTSRRSDTRSRRADSSALRMTRRHRLRR